MQPPDRRNDNQSNCKNDELKREHQICERPDLETVIGIVDEKREWPTEIPNRNRGIRARVPKIRRSVTW